MLEYLTWITASISLASNSIFGVIPPAHEQLKVPQCLASQITVAHEVLAENTQFKVIDVPGSDVKQLILLADQVQCGDIVNVSNQLTTAKKQSAQNLLQKSAVTSASKNNGLYVVKHQNEVNSALKAVVADNIWQTLNHLTAYPNRSATKDTGVAAAQWLKDKFEAMALEYGRTDTKTFFVKTGWYNQPSLVTVIGKDIKAPGIVIGAHMDTLDGRMPGADEGSGAAAIMETARVLLASKTELKHPIYIIWYAAKNRDLAGSHYVVSYFDDHSIRVKAALQLDQSGYQVHGDPTMWVFTDNSNKDLSDYISKLITTYIRVPVNYSRCGAGCSDHVSWNEEDIPATFSSESTFENFNPNIGTPSDTMDLLNLDHITNFSKLALAFAIEMAFK